MQSFNLIHSYQMQSPAGARVILSGREYDYFSGTGYLGLQNHPEVVQAALTAIQSYGFSTASPRGGFGEHGLYLALEAEICAFLGVEKAVTFASGYLGMAVLTRSESNQYDHIFIDADAHHSLWDAAAASNRPLTPFKHCSSDHLQAAIKRELDPGGRPLLLTDGVFPISGEIAPLVQYLAVMEPYGGRILIDDAHAAGVLGPNGRGTCDYFGITSPVCASAGTLSKALGGFGGFIGGEAGWIDRIDRSSPILAGSSPLPIPVAAASARALNIARSQPELRARLAANTARVRTGLRALGWALPDTPVPIICLAARPGINLLRLRRGLLERGLAVTHVRDYPSSPPGGCLRVAVFATHTADQIDRLVSAVSDLI